MMLLLFSALALMLSVHAGPVVKRALSLANISLKEAAISMDMGLPQASRQLSGEEHCHLDRWLTVPGLGPWMGVAFAVEVGLPVEVDTILKLSMARMAIGYEQRLVS